MFIRFMRWPENVALPLRTLLIPALLLLVGCGSEDKKTDPPIDTATGTCVDCHTDQASLIASAAPDTTEVPENPGEG